MIDVNRLPVWAWAAPAAACVLLAGKSAGVLSAEAPLVLMAAAVLLGGAVFASVHHAEVIALRVGEPFGSLVLAVAVTVIESSLILSLMLGGDDGSQQLARDTVFATVMIVLNGIVGLCLIAGGARHREQAFGTDAAAAALSVLGTLAVITLVLPNFTFTARGPQYSTFELTFVATVSVVLYAVFLFVQTVRHRTYFLDPADSGSGTDRPTGRSTAISLGLLVMALVAVVLLAKTLAPALERAVLAAGLPVTFVGVVIAAVVLLPEGISAVRAAHANRLQASLNLALGSALATIGLTIPIVALAALLLGAPLDLGLAPSHMVILVLSLFISTVTLATGRTTILQGAVHLVLFAIFLLLMVVA